MHWLRAKEIKDSPNSQAVPKILVLLKNDIAWIPHWLRFLLFLQYSIAWLVSPSFALSNALNSSDKIKQAMIA